MGNKYELTDETERYDGFHRIRALKDFGDVEKGELGGFIESEDNLSQEGNCWVADNAMVFDDARISGNARVSEYAQVFDNAKVSGNAEIAGISEIGGNALVNSDFDYQVFHNNWSSGRFFTYTKSNHMWRVGCFYGTGDELIKKAYQDSEDKGKHYELYVNLVKEQEKLEEKNIND